ncbi:MAG: SDR family NAD(P)-dependent oxidoreductase [Bryobacteraceae bacterium]
MRALVTGGAGFIGSHLCASLVASGASVVVLDNLHRGSREALARCGNAVEFIEGDIRDLETVHRAIEGADAVFHLAAQSSVISGDEDTDYTLSSNVEGTRNVLEAAAQQARSRSCRVVFASSREVYGDPEEVPVLETAPLLPKNTYGISKAMGEALCHEFAEASSDDIPNDNLRIAILRLANVYGPGDRGRVLPIFLENALAGRPLQLFGGQQVIDFLWVGTAVEALVNAVRLPDARSENTLGPNVLGPINIGSGKGTTVAELARRVVEATGSRSKIEIAPPREIEVSRFIAGLDEARRLLGLEPPVDPLYALPEMIRAELAQVE